MASNMKVFMKLKLSVLHFLAEKMFGIEFFPTGKMAQIDIHQQILNILRNQIVNIGDRDCVSSRDAHGFQSTWIIRWKFIANVGDYTKKSVSQMKILLPDVADNEIFQHDRTLSYTLQLARLKDLPLT